MNENKILIIDLETTGLSSFYDKIIEVAIVELDLSNGKIKNLYERIFNPMIKFKDLKTAWVVENKFINLKEIILSEKMKDSDKEEIQFIISSYTTGITAYNNTFDFGFLKANGIDIDHKLKCPMKLATDILKLKGAKSSYKWPNFQECYDYYFPNTKYVEKHRAFDDAYNEAKVVYEMYKLNQFEIN